MRFRCTQNSSTTHWPARCVPHTSRERTRQQPIEPPDVFRMHPGRIYVSYMPSYQVRSRRIQGGNMPRMHQAASPIQCRPIGDASSHQTCFRSTQQRCIMPPNTFSSSLEIREIASIIDSSGTRVIWFVEFAMKHHFLTHRNPSFRSQKRTFGAPGGNKFY